MIRFFKKAMQFVTDALTPDDSSDATDATIVALVELLSSNNQHTSSMLRELRILREAMRNIKAQGKSGCVCKQYAEQALEKAFAIRCQTGE